MADGKGTLSFYNGDKYIGNFSWNKRNGYGVYSGSQLDNRFSYEGFWLDDKKHGLGVYWFPNKDQYEGMWHEDLRHGNGTYDFSSGESYNGEWRYDQIHGKGVFQFS